jgi:ElaB/YqjD/DUF883 family membrane-anchored ribosome-binding protein
MAKKSSDIGNINDVEPISGLTSLESPNYTDNTLAADTDSDLLEMSDNDTSDDTEHIKAQIEETRANLGDTIDAIQDRLSFANISEQVSEQVNNAIETAKDSAYEATIGKVVHFMKNTGSEISRSSLISSAKNNPLPLLLIGVGAGLLAYQSYGKQQSRSLSGYRAKTHPRYTGQGAGESASSSILSSAQDSLGSVKDSVSNAAGSALDSVSKVAGSTYSGAGDIAGRAYEKVGEFGTKAQETYEQYLEEKPWAIGAVALVAGAAIGLAIPSSRYEGELMGEARLNLLSKAQESASGLVDKAKQVAAEAGNVVKEEVKSQLDDQTV